MCSAHSRSYAESALAQATLTCESARFRAQKGVIGGHYILQGRGLQNLLALVPAATAQGPMRCRRQHCQVGEGLR